MKKILIPLLLVFIVANSFAQNAIVGKWKPVFMEVEGMLKADFKTGKTETFKQFDDMVAKSKELSQNKMMIEMGKMMLVESIKGTVEEFTSKGEHIVTNPKLKTNITTQYTYDAKKKLLTISNTKLKNNQAINIEFTATGFRATSEMQNPFTKQNNKMQVVYEKG